MPIAANVTKQRLAAGKIAFGLGIRSSRSIDVVRAARAAGCHYMFIDLEHGLIGIETVSQLCIAGLEAGVTPTVRIPGEDYDLAARLLDGGAQGIVVPHVDTAEQARQAVRACKFAPLGERSSGGPLIQLDWEPLPAREATALGNDNVLLIMMIENPDAVANAEEIAAVPGVDVIAIGSNDLAAAMGIQGEYEHPDLLAAYTKVGAACRRNGVALRIGGFYDRRLLANSVEMGSRMIMIGHDFSFMMQGIRAKMAELKSAFDSSLTA